jgi:hypothetical protein
MQGLWIILVMTIAGALISFSFFPLTQKTHKKTTPTTENKNPMSEENKNPMSEENKNGKNHTPLTDRWVFRLALLGIALGIFGGVSKGILDPAILLGFTLPFICIFGLIGAVIDFLKKKP